MDEKYLKNLRDYYYSFCDSLREDSSGCQNFNSSLVQPVPKLSPIFVIQPTAEKAVASQPTYLDTVSCIYCGKSYKGRYNLRCHVFTSHWNCFYECSYSGCLTFYSSLQELHKHMSGDDDCKKHTGPKHYNCTECGVPFENVQAMNQHKQWHHPSFFDQNGLKNAAAKCEICQLVTSASIMKQHQQNRRCENCNSQSTCSFLHYRHIANCRKT
ncbi:zinc finger protein 484-like [Cloeon dipterum]|uniref:zinc finger protein 484-like n=1 Tax=Cloeon dipterum TaxID=197152 RepID=UPI00322033AE